MTRPLMPLFKTNLIVCGDCEVNGRRRQVLGEIDSSGDVLIRRFHGSLTRIISTNFAIQCEECKDVVYQRLGTVSITSIGTIGL